MFSRKWKLRLYPAKKGRPGDSFSFPKGSGGPARTYPTQKKMMKEDKLGEGGIKQTRKGGECRMERGRTNGDGDLMVKSPSC